MKVVFSMVGRQSATLHFSKPITYAEVRRGNKVFLYRKFREPVTSFSLNLVHGGKYTFSPDPHDIVLGPMKIHDVSSIKLPAKERNAVKPWYVVKDAKLTTTPCRIYPDIGEIRQGPVYDLQPEQIQRFIMLHELGHFFYETEEYADLFALYHFLKDGNNESAAFHALQDVLSDNEMNRERIGKVYYTIQTKNLYQ